MDFDFTTHLSKLLSIPPSQITIEALTGGMLNVAVRASFTPPVDLTQFGYPQSVPSVVLKYAPPHIASEPDVPLSTIRQDIEAHALILLDPKYESALPVSSLFMKYPNIKIPRFIHHDSEEHLLMMTDLGSSIVQVDDWLTREPAPNPEDIERIAKDLGRFLAEFVITTSEPSVELLALFPSNLGLITQFNIYLINNLKAILTSHGVPDTEILIKRVENAMRDYGKTDSCLGIVDLWRNNIVIDSDKNICLIDWEYFGLSNASCEMSLLGEYYFRSILIFSF
jgi:Phosphotransferase enzyme family